MVNVVGVGVVVGVHLDLGSWTEASVDRGAWYSQLWAVTVEVTAGPAGSRRWVGPSSKSLES